MCIRDRYRITRDPAQVRAAEKIILPGVGHFGQMMRALDELGLREALVEKARSGVPFLGICLGLQALFETSAEAPGERGLALFAGCVERFPLTARVPHMGWNEIVPVAPSRLLSGLAAKPYVYFAHSFYCPRMPVSYTHLDVYKRQVDDNQEVIVLQPSYAMYRFYAEVAGARVIDLTYRPENLAFPLEELLARISPATRAILIANPNNPTGTLIGIEAIEAILRRAPHSAVLIDEAYYEFCGVTALPLVARRQNLFVSRTFSKAYGLAGLRIGCLFSQTANVQFLHKAQSPYSVNILAAIAARAAVTDGAYVENFVRQAVAARDLLCVGFKKRGIAYYESHGNFVLFRAGEKSIFIRDALRDRGVLVRDRSYEIPGCVRVTAGTPQQVERFFAAFDEVLSEARA